MHHNQQQKNHIINDSKSIVIVSVHTLTHTMCTYPVLKLFPMRQLSLVVIISDLNSHDQCKSNQTKRYKKKTQNKKISIKNNVAAAFGEFIGHVTVFAFTSALRVPAISFTTSSFPCLAAQCNAV